MNPPPTNTFLLFLLSVIGYISCYLLNGFLAHHLSIYIYADYSVALRALDFVVCLTLFGTDVAAVCYLSKYLLNNQSKFLQFYIRWNVKLVSMNILTVRILGWLLFGIMIILHLSGIHHIKDYPMVIFILWVTPFAAIFKLLCSFLTGMDFFLTSMMLSNVFFYFFQFLLFAGFIFIIHKPLSYINIAIILGGTYAILGLLCYRLIDRNIIALIRQGLKRFFIIPPFRPKWFPAVSKIIVNSIIFMLICTVDLFIVRIFSPNPKDAGCYAAILSIVSFIYLLPKGLYQDLKPLLSYNLTSPSGRILIQKQMNRTNKIVCLLTTTLCLCIIFFSNALLGYFGPEYLRAKTALILLTIGLWYSGLSQIAGSILIYANLEDLALTSSILLIVFTLCITIPVTYYFGLNGIALSTGIAFSFNSLYCSYQIKKHLGLNSMIIPGYMPRVQEGE